jgi:hypothetical protein
LGTGSKGFRRRFLIGEMAFDTAPRVHSPITIIATFEK